MKIKKVCILVRNDVERDPRVNRQIRWLSDTGDYKITVIGFGNNGVSLPGVDKTVTFGLKPYSLFEKFLSAPGLFLCNITSSLAENIYWSTPANKDMYNAVLDDEYDIIHANDWDTLPMAAKSAKKMKKTEIIYDAHEFATLEFEESLKFRLFYKKYRQILETSYIKNAATIITVSGLIARKLAEVYGVNPTVIMNCPDYNETKINETKSEIINLCHHGVYHSSRGIEELIKSIKYLDQEYALHFRLICDVNIKSKLEKLAADTAPGRIFFHQPVRPSEIVSTINQYDIGVYALRPVNFNSAAALPNKFFEFIMSGLCLCIGPTPEMKQIVEKYDCGVVCKGFDASSIAESVKSLSKKTIMDCKKRSLDAAQILNARVEGQKMLRCYKEVLGFS
ncbi:glycosyltransferase [Pelotomaculum propionicicum]|uniref:glycosyltransferase n=1 Tax=Pelotomaculum propionicicum TaxID=258475 RepID=UPI003B7623E3